MTLPRISLVTPSYNKARFIEATLRSVLDQGYSALEYGVVDGGSTDGSLEILDRYRDRLAFAISESDHGMYDALSKGFARTGGEIMGYLGADDLHLPWTLSVVGEIFSAFPEVEWITSGFPVTADARGRVVRARRVGPFCRSAFFAGANLPGFKWHSDGWIQQESTFWRRSLWEKVGGLDASLRLAGDFDLWCRFFKLADLVAVATPLAAFRRHGDQITEIQPQAYGQEALAVLRNHGGKPDGYVLSRLRLMLGKLRIARSGIVGDFDFRDRNWRLRAY